MNSFCLICMVILDFQKTIITRILDYLHNLYSGKASSVITNIDYWFCNKIWQHHSTERTFLSFFLFFKLAEILIYSRHFAFCKCILL